MKVAVNLYDPPTDQDDEGVCGGCRRSWESRLVPPPRHHFVILNLRTGKYHSGGDSGITACGVDATAENWVWPI